MVAQFGMLLSVALFWISIFLVDEGHRSVKSRAYAYRHDIRVSASKMC